MRLQFNPILYLRKDKQKQDGSIPVYIRFQRIDGVEPKFPFGISVQLEDWNDGTRRPKNPTLKLIVDKKVTRIEQRILNAVANDKKITKEMLREFLEERDPQEKSFYDYFDEYIAKQNKRGKMGVPTMQGYTTTRKALKEFRKQIKLSDINVSFVEGFDKFLLQRGMAQGRGEVKGTRYNRLKHINTVVKDIHRQGIAINDPFAKGEFDLPKPADNDVFLETHELKAMISLTDTLPLYSRWDRVLLMYLFACFTGLRISDALGLKWEEVKLGDDEMYLRKVAKKTKREFTAPIFDSAAKLVAMSVENIDSVEAELNVFYQYSPTTVNNTLKELAELAGVDKLISFHSARRTCATLLAAEGTSPIFIRDMLGHKSLKMTDRYIKTSTTLMALKAKNIDVFSMERLGFDGN